MWKMLTWARINQNFTSLKQARKRLDQEASRTFFLMSAKYRANDNNKYVCEAYKQTSSSFMKKIMHMY